MGLGWRRADAARGWGWAGDERDRGLCHALLQVDTDTYDLLRSLNMANLPGVKQQQVCGPLAPVQVVLLTL